MIYYYFDLYKQDNTNHATEITTKEGGATPYEITEKVTILQLYDQDKGSILRFLSSSKLVIDSFLEGFKLGSRADTIL
jgi:hypothetical protein